jgi:hypothetical protein
MGGDVKVTVAINTLDKILGRAKASLISGVAIG